MVTIGIAFFFFFKAEQDSQSVVQKQVEIPFFFLSQNKKCGVFLKQLNDILANIPVLLLTFFLKSQDGYCNTRHHIFFQGRDNEHKG